MCHDDSMVDLIGYTLGMKNLGDVAKYRLNGLSIGIHNFIVIISEATFYGVNFLIAMDLIKSISDPFSNK